MLLLAAAYGAEDAERANLPFIRGNVAAANGQPCAVYLAADAVWLATIGGAGHVRYGGHPSVAEMAAVFVSNGGQIWVSGESARPRGIGCEQLIAGARLVTAADVARCLVRTGSAAVP